MALVRPVVISGPSGGGKSTLLKKLFTEYSDVLAFSVSHTTRKARPKEVNGKDYHFIDKPTFEEMISNKKFLEYAQFSGNYYGTSFQSITDIQESRKICILDLEINGVKSIKASNLDARYIFIKTPSLEILKSRLIARETDSMETIDRRLSTACEAIEYANQPGSYDHVIINDDVEVAYQKLKGILYTDMECLRKEGFSSSSSSSSLSNSKC